MVNAPNQHGRENHNGVCKIWQNNLENMKGKCRGFRVAADQFGNHHQRKVQHRGAKGAWGVWRVISMLSAPECGEDGVPDAVQLGKLLNSECRGQPGEETVSKVCHIKRKAGGRVRSDETD